MDEKYICRCGLYCLNCAVKAKIEPAGRKLYEEMKKAGFEEVIPMMPGGAGFWAFLKEMVENGTCVSCQDGSGNPGCAVRICAREKGVGQCALCGDYPCGHIQELFSYYPGLEKDNALLRDKGMEAWAALQDRRHADGFTYPNQKNGGSDA